MHYADGNAPLALAARRLLHNREDTGSASMTPNTLMTFMVFSQIAICAYLLYSFNTIDRASRSRHEALTAHLDKKLEEMESRLNGGPRQRVRAASEGSSIPGGGETELLHPRQA